MQNQINIATLLNALETNGNVFVEFRTKTGKQRTMDCTRALEFIPDELHDGMNTHKLNGPDIICVYDNIIGDWRAFRKDSVISFR